MAGQRAKIRNNQEKELEVELESQEERQDEVLNTTQRKRGGNKDSTGQNKTRRLVVSRRMQKCSPNL